MSLTPRQEQRAVRYNTRHMARIGWARSWDSIVELFGLGRDPTRESFAQATARWQRSYRGAGATLSVDGKLGPNTWRNLRMQLTPTSRIHARPAWVQGRRVPPLSPVDSTLNRGIAEPPSTPAPNRTPPTAPAEPASPGRPMGGSAVRGADSTTAVASGRKPPWLLEAEVQMRLWRNVVESNSEMDGDYFDAVPYFGGQAREHGARPGQRPGGGDPHWCSAFVNYCLHTTGYSHTGNAYARSFLKPRLWRFDPIPDPRPGAIIVVGLPNGAHIGFLYEAGNLPHNPGRNVSPRARGIGGTFKMLGGNQSNTVQVSDEHRVMIAVTKGGITSPYLWPKVGTPNCNADLPTANPHFCGNRFEEPAVNP
ncbi:MAG: hypothetical protein ACFB03_10270 [Paracoccaceae bacterium]